MELKTNFAREIKRLEEKWLKNFLLCHKEISVSTTKVLHS
jgi:hypothetical protein